MGLGNFGQRLRAARRGKGMTLRALSSATGISFSQISRLERQKHAVRADDVERLAHALGLTVQYFTTTESGPLRIANHTPFLGRPLIPGAAQEEITTYPGMRLTRLETGRRMNLSRIARASTSWMPVVVRGKLLLTGPALKRVATAGAKLSRKVLIWHTVHAEALELAELLWVEEKATDAEVATGSRDPHARPAGPLRGAGRIVGYFSTAKQADPQGVEAALRDAGCSLVLHDLAEARTLTRPALLELLDRLEPGATLVTPSLRMLNLRTHEVLELIGGVNELGGRFRTLDGSVDTNRPGTTEALLSLARLEPNPRSSRIRAGMLAAAGFAKSGSAMGRPPALNPAQVDELRNLVIAGLSTGEIRRRLGYTKSTVERYVRRIREGVL